ncbi:Pc21g06000 [Penicillium rubens Wisconsin 54-1255]|uniref:Pc21g06000 protein n=1 Tax=Penicillium rubens (strain ATCC 28089 / DSM 1075 / NRRL 1951 / Wisconsin 54-1255) TaxID=500485 RepID=B6HIF7_PENRW|nr:Pc21g06000 [Penicillium rubens Wisconsin 54-1255]
MQSQTDQKNTPNNFPGLAPFPDDVSTAPLLRLSSEKLLAGDPTEHERLFQASTNIGFFYLDLSDSEQGSSLLGDADNLFQLGERLFELSLEEKQQYDFSGQNSYFGYKAQGAAVSKDDILSVSDPLPAPEVLHKSRARLASFMRGSHAIVTLILEILNDQLALPRGTLSNLHRQHAVSGDQVRFVKAPPQPVDDRRTALGQHTDFGSVTVLFNRLGGLQVLPPGADAEWVYARPLPGHAIINLGDAMVKFTNGLFRSNIHRVVAPPGLQAESTRYSLVYFARPEDSVMLHRLEGSDRIPVMEDGQSEEEINSKDWIIRRALGRRVDRVNDVDFEESAGTEQLSRRIKAQN